MNYSVTIYSILFNNNNEFLTLKYTNGDWAFPGGHLESGENWKKALLREINEEIGVKDNSISIIHPIFIDNWQYDQKEYFGSVLFGKIYSNDIKLSDEHSEYKWVNQKSCRNLTPQYSTFFDIVDNAYKYLEQSRD
ncbi:MAG: NUDIX domain-containing protein [Spirochaetaceae bacterium]